MARHLRERQRQFRSADSVSEVHGHNAPVGIVGRQPASCRSREYSSGRDKPSVFSLPAFLVGREQKNTSFGAGIAEIGNYFARYSLAPHIRRMEDECDRKLVFGDSYVKFNMDGLLQAHYGKAVRHLPDGALASGLMTINEARELEDLPKARRPQVRSSVRGADRSATSSPRRRAAMNTDFFLKQMDDAFTEAKTKELMAKWAERRQEAKQGLAIGGPLPDAAKGGPLNAREVDGELHLDLYHPIARAGSLMSLIGAVTPEDFSSAFALADKDAHVRIFVDSPGGALLPARAIMAQMERHEGRITWTADGMAASAAALISLAADERVANKGSRYLMHRSWATATGDANVHEEIVAELRKNDDEIAAEYAAVSQADEGAVPEDDGQGDAAYAQGGQIPWTRGQNIRYEPAGPLRRESSQTRAGASGSSPRRNPNRRRNSPNRKFPRVNPTTCG